MFQWGWGVRGACGFGQLDQEEVKGLLLFHGAG